VSLRSGTLARFARMAGLIAKRRENGVSPRPRFERVRKIANGVHRTRRPNPKQLWQFTLDIKPLSWGTDISCSWIN
jgi:ribosomal protein S21